MRGGGQGEAVVVDAERLETHEVEETTEVVVNLSHEYARHMEIG